MEPGLFGIKNSNRDFTQEDSWGKNQFNSSFPAALGCYMYSRKMNPAYLTLNNDLQVIHSEISVAELYGIQPDSPNIYFAFERDYPPYQKLVVGNLPRIDLVTMDLVSGGALQGVEIKLTALPDNSTCNLNEDGYSCEIVIRPDSVIYLALSILEAYQNKIHDLHDLLYPHCSKILDWADAESIHETLPEMINAIDDVLMHNIGNQIPLIMQPVWKTMGKSVTLDDNCLDIFVWSNYAFTRLFVDSAKQDLHGSSSRISRHTRTVIWLSKMLYDYSINDKVDYASIIDELSMNTKNDKAFAVSGRVTHPYLASEILKKPRIKKDEIKRIILGNGHKLLSPERRFDAIILNTPGLFD
ncbi:HindVP family restriction endonuclease [Chloroflexota bacterium]